MGLFKFETLLFFKNKKNISIFLISFLIISILYISNTIYTNNTNKLGEYQSHEQDLNQSIRDISKQAKNNNEAKKALQEVVEEKNLVKQQIKANKTRKWKKKEFQTQIALDKLLLQQSQEGSTVTDPEVLSQANKEIQQDSILVKKNIHPSNEPTETEGINFVYRCLSILFPYLMVLLIIVLISDVTTNEKMNGTIGLVNTLPVKLRRILNVKIFISFIYSLTFIFASLLFALLLGTIFNRFGSIKYPIEILNFEGNYWIPIIDFIVRSILLTIALLIFLSCFAQFLSVFVSNSLLIMFILFGCFFVTQIMTTVKSNLYHIIHFIPFTFADIPNIVSGQSIVKFGNPYITISNGFFILILSSLVLYLITLALINKKGSI